MVIGNITHLNIDIDQPEMKLDIAFNKLSLFIGANGSGKTLILKYTWAFGFIANQCAITGNNKEFATFVLKHTFNDFKTSGKIAMTFQSDVVLNITLEKGEVVEMDLLNLSDNVYTFSIPVFMSTDMRTFDQMCQYLNVRTLITKNDILKEEDMEKLLQMYKLYDITYVEGLIHKTDSGLKIPEKISEVLKENYDFKKKPVLLKRKDKVFVLVYEDETEESVLTLGKGHQSILNMLIANI